LAEVENYLRIGGNNVEVLSKLNKFFVGDEEAMAGIANLKFIKETVASMGFKPDNFIIDPTIARGLNYYTGVIFETN